MSSSIGNTSSNHWFSGDMLVFGDVIPQIIIESSFPLSFFMEDFPQGPFWRPPSFSYSAKAPWNTSLSFIFPIKYVIPKRWQRLAIGWVRNFCFSLLGFTFGRSFFPLVSENFQDLPLHTPVPGNKNRGMHIFGWFASQSNKISNPSMLVFFKAKHVLIIFLFIYISNLYKYKFTALSIYTYIYIDIGLSPFSVIVTTRIVSCLVGNPYKPSFATITGKGDNPIYIYILWRKHHLEALLTKC